MAFCPVFTQFLLFGKQPTFSCLLVYVEKKQYLCTRFRQMDRKNDTALLNRRCDHCLRSPHRTHSVSARRGPQ